MCVNKRRINAQAMRTISQRFCAGYNYIWLHLTSIKHGTKRCKYHAQMNRIEILCMNIQRVRVAQFCHWLIWWHYIFHSVFKFCIAPSPFLAIAHPFTWAWMNHISSVIRYDVFESCTIQCNERAIQCNNVTNIAVYLCIYRSEWTDIMLENVRSFRFINVDCKC